MIPHRRQGGQFPSIKFNLLGFIQTFAEGYLISTLFRAIEGLGDTIFLSFAEYLLAYESYEMGDVWLARRPWVTSGSSQCHGVQSYRN
jgi:hypothetical protein